METKQITDQEFAEVFNRICQHASSVSLYRDANNRTHRGKNIHLYNNVSYKRALQALFAIQAELINLGALSEGAQLPGINPAESHLMCNVAWKLRLPSEKESYDLAKGKKYYVVTKGSYSDYHIEAVTADKKYAEHLAKIYSDTWDEAMVEEYEEATRASAKPAWQITFAEDGSVSSAYALPIKEDASCEICSDGSASICCHADTKEVAIKIASDARAKHLALLEGL